MNFDEHSQGRLSLQCTFNNDVIFFYNGKLGSRYIDNAIGYKNKYHVIVNYNKNGLFQVKHARPVIIKNEKGIKGTTITKATKEYCEVTKGFLQKVFDGKSNKRDIIFVYRDPWKKYKSGIYQDYHSTYQNEFKGINNIKVIAKEFLDTLILGKNSKIKGIQEVKGDIFTGHAQRILINYKEIFDISNIDVTRCQLFNMEKYGLDSVLEKYGLFVDGVNKIDRPRVEWTDGIEDRKVFENILDIPLYKNVAKKILEPELLLYKWAETHKRNFTKLYKPSIKK